jgi:hypothetical protein
MRKDVKICMGRNVILYDTFDVVESASAIISNARRVIWQGNVGVYGDIPARNTIFADVTQAPYNADNTGSADATSAIQAAINACTADQVVYIPAGTYKIGTSAGLKIKSGITVRGAGKGQTILKGPAGSTAAYLVGIIDSPSWNQTTYWEAARTVTAGLGKDSTAVSVNITSWASGDLILLDQLANAAGDPMITNIGTEGTLNSGRDSGTRCFGQVVELDSVSAGVANLKIPIYFGFDMAKTPQASRMVNSYIISNAGLEELTVDNSLSVGAPQTNYGTIILAFTKNCWLLNVEVNTVRKVGITIEMCYRDTIRGCQVHNSYSYGSNAGYGIGFIESVSACLIENNKLNHITVGVILQGVASGNVIAYNYIYDLQYTDNSWVRNGTLTHGGHPHMNLFEGNLVDGPNMGHDFYWGSSSHNTHLRNYVAKDPARTNALMNLELWKGQQYLNFVGGVYGNGNETSYQETSYAGKNTIYLVDYTDSGSQDGRTLATILRHGNWDAFDNAIVWDAGISNHVIPASYYLASKPSWWGSGIWPSIGSDLTPRNSGIPASGLT